MDTFQYIQVDFLHGDGDELAVIDSFVVSYEELRSNEAEAVAALLHSRAEQLLLAGQSLRRLMYKDDEEDWCTLNADTLHDALCFIAPCGDGLGQLQFCITADQVSVPTELPSESPVPVEVQPHDFCPEPREIQCAKEAEPEVEPLSPQVCSVKTETQLIEEPLLEPKEEVAEAVEVIIEAIEVTPAPLPSAVVLKCSELDLGAEALEDCSVRGDATPEFAEIIAKAGVRQAVRIGRVAIMANEDTPSVPVIAKCIVRNDGEVPWPDSTALTFLFGEDFNFRHLPLGAINPGEVAEVVVDLQLPARSTPCTSSASWALIDVVTGYPLGPVLLFEAVWLG